MATHWLPLEMKLQEFAEKRKDEFADQHVDYWDRYTTLLSNLKSLIYPNINAGLACLSKTPGFYTDHGEKHFDEVVRYAGLLLEDTFSQTNSSLTPYELYLLLCAIRVHDAGNINGREEHEKRAVVILRECGGQIASNTDELGLIGAIAQAHGGRTIDEDKDTIGIDVPEDTTVGGVTVRPQLVAALVRFADEICEHSSRAAQHLLASGSLPDESKLFHLYAKSIVGAKPDRINKAFKLRFKLDTTLFTTKFKTPKDKAGKQAQKFLIDDVWDRINKLNHERVYCNRFLLPSMQTHRIEIKMEFTRPKMMGGTNFDETCNQLDLTITDKGYPSVPDYWRKESKVKSLNGTKCARRVW